MQDPTQQRTLMFGILRDPAKTEAPFEAVFYDTLNDVDARVQFDRLQRVEVVFSGYTAARPGRPDGLDPAVRDAVEDVVERLNAGEPLQPAEIGSILGGILA